MKKIFLFLLLAASAAYGLLLYKPALYFGSSREYKCFTLRASGELPAAVDTVLDKVLERLSTSEFFTPDTRFEVYLAAGPGEFGAFCPFVSGEYVRVNPLSGGIFLAAADFPENRALPARGEAQPRLLSRVIAAAAARELVRRKLEVLTYLFMRPWKTTGYAERVSGGLEQYVPADLCAKASPAGSPLGDYKYGLAVDFVMNDERISFSDLLDKNYSYESVEKQLMRRYCGK